MLYNYLITGISVQSDHVIEGLSTALLPVEGRPEVLIETFDISHPTFPTQTVEGSRFSFSVVPGLRFTIDAGNRIAIYRDHRITNQQVTLFLLGSAWGALCHQRGEFPLHCSSVSIGNKAFAFVADSGGGKSTLAASLCNSNVRHVCDDVAVVNLASNRGVTVHAMPKGLKLWREASDALGLERQALAFSDDTREKYYVATPAGPDQTLLDLSAVYEIFFSDEIERARVQQVTGIEAVKTIYRNVYRVEWLDLLNSSGRALAQARTIAERMPVFHFTRPRALNTLKDSSAFLAEHFQTLRGASP